MSSWRWKLATAGAAEAAGSMPMGNIWAWPSRMLSTEQTLAAMIELGQRLVAPRQRIPRRRPSARNHARTGRVASDRQPMRSLARPALAEPMPRLGAACRRQPAGSRHSRRLRQGARPEFLQPARAGVRVGGPVRVSDGRIRRRVSRSLHAAAAEAADAALSSDRSARSADRRRHRRRESTMACRKRCPNGSPPTA